MNLRSRLPQPLAAALAMIALVLAAAIPAASATADRTREGAAPAGSSPTAESSASRSAREGKPRNRGRGKGRSRRTRPRAFRRCGRSRSPRKLARRTVRRRPNGTIRTTRLFCDGSRRIVIRRPSKPPKVITVPGPPVPGPGPGPAPAPVDPAFRLTVLHNNDGESKYKVGDSIANYGGVANFRTVLDKLRGEARDYTDAEIEDGAKRKGTVTISSGDNILAGLNLRASFERFDSGEGVFYDDIALGALGYDALTIGNHEYDFGPERFAQLVEFFPGDAPFLSANTDFSGERELQDLFTDGRIAESAVAEKGGELIGVIGVTPANTPSISSPGAVTFSDQIATEVNTEAAELTRQGVDKIVLSSHLQGLASERALVPSLRNVDVVIAGGGDELLANADDVLIPGTGAPVGPYPVLENDSTGASVPIVTTQGEYRYVGRLTATFDGQGRLTSIDDPRSGPVRVSAKTGDPDMVAPNAFLQREVVEPLTRFSAELAARIIGSTDRPLDGGSPNPIRQRESNLGDLVADGFRYTTNKAQSPGGPLADIAFSNGGGIRASIPGPQISEKSTFDVLPFDNFMVTVTGVIPERLKRLMEHGVAALPAGNGRFPQISGFRMEVDTSRQAQALDASGNPTTPGQRIRELILEDATPGPSAGDVAIVTGGATAPGAPDVNIATTNFTAGFGNGGNGGDGYPFQGLPAEAATDADGGFIPYQQSLFQFITDPSTSVFDGLRGRDTDGDGDGEITTADYPGTGRITITP